MSGSNSTPYDVTNPHVPTGAAGQAFLLRFDRLKRTASGHQPTGRYILLTMTRAEAATLAEQLQAALDPPTPDKRLS
jgi:hypothetical protein